MSEHLLQDIELKTDELIRRVHMLEKENAELKAQLESWHTEKARLIEKNEVARTRVEAMIARLKILDAES